MIILDASAAVEVFRVSSGAGVAVRDRLAPLERVHVPELFDLEVLSAIRGLERSGGLSGPRLDQALAALSDLRAERWRHEELRPGIWRCRHQFSIYDAAYVALAKLLDLPLITADARLAGAAGNDVEVELYAPG